MPKALVNMFIHFAICQTGKNGLGSQAELITSVGKKGCEVQIEPRGHLSHSCNLWPFYKHGRNHKRPKSYCILTYNYRVAISKISAIIKGFMNTVIGITFSGNISYS